MSVAPPLWDEQRFQQDRDQAAQNFREERMGEDLGTYTDFFEEVRQTVATLLELTVDLTELAPRAVEVVADPELLEALRYVLGPPISMDDLSTIAEVPTFTPSKVTKEPWRAEKTVETALLGLDRNRFPWVSELRGPTENERHTAVVATAALIAQRRTMTKRANESKDTQELDTAVALLNAGFQQVETRPIKTLNDAPAAGSFCRESLLGDRKADLVVTLWDNRVMPLECKVSNSGTNSVKRLNGDAAVKAVHWTQQFGTLQVVPAAVLSGVFNVKNLQQAQADGLTIWWAHSLSEMVGWIESIDQASPGNSG